MAKIETKKAIVNLNGEEFKNGEEVFTIGHALANILLANEAGGKMKLYALAQKFWNDEEVELDAADLSLVKKAVETTKSYGALVAGQLGIYLEGLNDTK